jgi:hypothetical protein
LQYPLGVLAASTGSIGKGDARWSAAAPWSVVTGQRPEVSCLGLAGAGIKHRSTGLVHEQLGRLLQIGDQRVEDRAQLESCLVGGFCAYNWYWYIKAIIFYRRNGFDFSKDFGPKLYWSDFQDDDRYLAKPRDKFALVFTLMGIVKLCYDCGP